MTNRIAILAFCLLLVTTLSCADKDKDSGGSSGGSSYSSITFTPSSEHATGDIWLELKSADPQAGTFTLAFAGDGLADVYGCAGRLTFDRTIAQLDEALHAGGLEGTGATIIAKGITNDQGAVFGVSRSVDYQNGVSLTADKPVADLNFTVLAKGTTEMIFVENRSLCLTPDMERVEISHFIGGTLVVE